MKRSPLSQNFVGMRFGRVAKSGNLWMSGFPSLEELLAWLFPILSRGSRRDSHRLLELFYPIRLPSLK
jgi:hypothetical protein